MIHAPRPEKSVEVVQLKGSSYYERVAWAIKRYATRPMWPDCLRRGSSKRLCDNRIKRDHRVGCYSGGGSRTEVPLTGLLALPMRFSGPFPAAGWVWKMG